MFLRIFTLASSMLLSVCIYAQISSSIQSNVSLTSLTDTTVFALSRNSSALVFSPKFSVGVSHTNLFSMHNLSMSQINASKNNSNFATGLGLSFLGLESFTYSSAECAFAKKIGANYSIALKVFVEHFKEQESQYSQYRFIPEISAYARILPHLSLGTVFKNPFRIIQSDIASEMSIGCNYQIQKKLHFVTELTLNQDFEKQLNIGGEYALIPKLAVRIYVSNTNSPILFGLRYSKKKISVQYNSLFNSYLSLSYNLKLVASF